MSDTLVRTSTLLRFNARRDRIRGPVWVLGVAVFVPYVLTAYDTLLGEPEEMAAILSMVGNPAMRLFTGPGFGLGADTAGDALAKQLIFTGVYWSYILIFVGLMSIFLISRHTRQDEQSGRAELIRASAVGRNAPLTSALVWVLICNVALGVLIVAALLAFDSPLSATVLLGVATVGFGLFFAGVTAVAVQVSGFSSSASGLAGAALGVSYLVRGFGDMLAGPDQHGTWLSWLSPFGWAQQTAVYVDNRWWPAALLFAGALLLGGAAYILQTQRDFGSGMLTVRAGRIRAAGWVRSPLSVAALILRGQAFWWSFALLIAAIMYGSFTGAMVDAFAQLPDLFQQLMGGSEGALEGYLTLTVVMFRIVLAGYVVLGIGKLRAEEREGRLESLLATPISPRTWLAGGLAVITATAAVLAAGLGALAGAFGTGVDADPDWILRGLQAGAAGIPAVLLVLGLAAMLYALHPRLVGLTWIPVVAGGFISLFGDLIRLPDWVRQMSPFEHTPQMPAQPFEWGPILIQTAIAGVLVAVALARIRVRNIPGE
ncbi:MAG: ABC transporter permease [Propioniciclava sp.]